MTPTRARTPATCAILLRRELFERVGGFEERFRGMFEDQAFFAKVYLHGTTLVSPTILDRYRQHPGSHCYQALDAGTYHASQGRFLRWLEAYLATQPSADAALKRAMRQALWPFRHPWLHRVQGLVRAIGQQGLGATYRQFDPPLHLRLRARIRRVWTGPQSAAGG